MTLKTVIAIIALGASSCLTPANHERIFSARSKNLPDEITNQPLQFIQTKEDVESGNDLIAVFYKAYKNKNETIIEYTLAFRNEKNPSIIIDTAYEILRGFLHNRIEDLETIVVHYNDKTIKELLLPDTYGGKQRLEKTLPEHYTTRYRRQINTLYINTWNHMFADQDSNPLLEKYMWTLEKKLDKWVYRCSNGFEAEIIDSNRKEAEIQFKKINKTNK